MEDKCNNCGQPLPEWMSCEEWKKAGRDLAAQIMQPGGLIVSGSSMKLSILRKKHWWSNKIWINRDCFSGEEYECDENGRKL